MKVASAAPKAATTDRRSTSCAATPREGNSTRSSEFERAMISDQFAPGLRGPGARGKRLGRPPIAPALEKRIREALADPWAAWHTGHCRAARRQSIDSAAHQPPFRRRKRRRGLAARGVK